MSNNPFYFSPGRNLFMTSAAMTTGRPATRMNIQLWVVSGSVSKMDCINGMYTTARIDNIDPAIPRSKVLLPNGFILNTDFSRDRLL